MLVAGGLQLISNFVHFRLVVLKISILVIYMSDMCFCHINLPPAFLYIFLPYVSQLIFKYVSLKYKSSITGLKASYVFLNNIRINV
jgi:hypothetical protein